MTQPNPDFESRSSDAEQPTDRPPESAESTPDASVSEEQKKARDAHESTEGRDFESELNQLRNQFLRTQAELDNFRKRARRELEEERRYAVMPLMRDLIVVLDNLQRAIDAASQNASAEPESTPGQELPEQGGAEQGGPEQGGAEQGMLSGVKMVASHLQSVLQQHHCHGIEAVGQPFDPNLHEAVGQAPSEQYDAGTVMHVTLPGYKLHDRVVRPSHVLVSTGPPGTGAANPN